VIKAYPEMSHYTLSIPTQPNLFPLFYIDQLKRWTPHNGHLFPGREYAWPSPVMVDGLEEFMIECILNSCKRGRSWQFLVCWSRQPASEDHWLSYASLRDCAALD
ncbi:hypothetical protein GGU10DRAFT_236833, partial [Lentinula aff. detonsa]